MATTLPTFEHTPIESIPGIAAGLRATFLSHKTRPLEYRIQQLRKLYWGLNDYKETIIEACKKDLGKPAFETFIGEVNWVMNDCIYLSQNLPRFAKDEKPEDVEFTNKVFGPRIRKDPMGAVLIIGAFNFPIRLSLSPFVGAIAAGCTAVLKPSESSPHSAAVMQKMIAECLDPTAYTVVNGAVPESSCLLEQKWDKIFYTGSANVGTIIAKKAAETLTPVTLELGGRNPAIITKHANARLAARRLLWAKIFNAGQVCVSQNYILVDREILPAFLKELNTTIHEFFPNGVKNSPDYGRIATPRQFAKLKKMLDETKGKIILGGTMDESELFIEPTVIQVDSLTDSLIEEESFGPFIPILPVTDLDEAIKIANEVHDTPLGIYPFGNNKELQQVLDQTRSGGASLNDGFTHITIQSLPFGGVGTSGQGSYHGKASFDAFTHRRSITKTPNWVEGMLAVRYPPFTAKKQKQFESMGVKKPNFDRACRTLGWSAWLKGLLGLKGLVAVIVAVGIRLYLQRRSKL